MSRIVAPKLVQERLSCKFLAATARSVSGCIGSPPKDSGNERLGRLAAELLDFHCEHFNARHLCVQELHNPLNRGFPKSASLNPASS